MQTEQAGRDSLQRSSYYTTSKMVTRRMCGCLKSQGNFRGGKSTLFDLVISGWKIIQHAMKGMDIGYLDCRTSPQWDIGLTASSVLINYMEPSHRDRWFALIGIHSYARCVASEPSNPAPSTPRVYNTQKQASSKTVRKGGMTAYSYPSTKSRFAILSLEDFSYVTEAT